MSDGRLYRLLPAIYRERDHAVGGPLAALLAVMEEELAAAEAETATMYENAFVETADAAALVRLAALVGVEQLATAVASLSSPRRLVANAVAYHRSKGVPGSLERAASDVTGWPARVVEGFALLGRTQHLGDVRSDRGAMLDVRTLSGDDPVRDPFPVASTRPDVRAVQADPARRGPSTVTVFVWPIRSLPAGPARPATVTRPRGCFTFHPLGLDQPLFTRPSPSAGRPGAAQIPRRITRRLLAAELDALFGAASGTSIAIALRGRPLGPADVAVVDLGDWTARPTETSRVALDPERGRLAFAGRVSAQQVEIEACYGAAGDLGGGSYDRRATLATGSAEVRVGRADGEDAAAAVAEAVRSAGAARLVLTIVDDLVLDTALDLVLVPGADVVIQAADATRPALAGGLTAHALDGPASLTLNGLAIGAGITIAGAVQLRVTHCTLPDGVRTGADDQGARSPRVVVDHSYCGPILLTAGATVEGSSSVIDGGAGPALAAASPDDVRGLSVTLQQVTTLGPVHVGELDATACVFTADVSVQRQQTGSVRFSYVSPGSRTPARERCQPDLASAAEDGADDGARWVRPVFVSLAPGDPGYAMLSPHCPAEIAEGAEGGGEMGAYGDLGRPQRRAALRTVVGSFLPYGLDAGIVEVP